MADKTSTTLVPITFVSGEQPPGDKLTAITSQLRSSVGKMESLIGDPHGEGFPYASSLSTQLSPGWGRSVDSNALLTNTSLSPAVDRRLDIANIARLIGPASNLNPKMQSEASQITETIPSGTLGYQLKYKPEDPNAANTPVLSSTSEWSNYDPSGILIDSDKWHVSERGYLTSRTALSAPVQITYTTDPSKYGNGSAYQNSNFNVIPSPNQISSNGVGVTVAAISGGKHRVTFPTITHQQSNKAISLTELGDVDFNYGLTYTLPQIVQTLSPGDVIPNGFVTLYNHTSSLPYREAQYEYVGPSEIDVSGVDLTSEIAASNVFYVVTVGTDITTSIDDLRNKLAEHTHDGRFGEQPVEASEVVGWNKTAAEFLPSSIADNQAPQYLRRTGYEADAQVYNDNNLMIGDLGLGSESESRGSKYSNTGDSYKLFFGSVGSYIYKDSDGDLRSSLVNYTNSWKMDHAIHVTATDTSSGSGLDTQFPNTSIFTDDPSGGNVGISYGAYWGNGAVLGPVNTSIVGSASEISKWEIDDDGKRLSVLAAGPKFETSDGTLVDSNGWVAPKFQVIHYAKRVDSADSEVTISTGITPSGSASSSRYSEVKIKLPYYLSHASDWGHTADATEAHTAIMGATLLVRSEGSSSSNKFHAAGSGADSVYDVAPGGGGSSHIINYNSANQEVVSFCILNDEVIIHLAESGDFQVGPGYWRSGGGTLGSDSLAVKLTLFVAAPGQNLS
jgi:hypothetical protein